jgi:hypothetical protein
MPDCCQIEKSYLKNRDDANHLLSTPKASTDLVVKGAKRSS